MVLVSSMMAAAMAAAPAPSAYGATLPVAQATTEGSNGSGVTVYQAAFFAGGQITSALDMISRLPGFTLDGGSGVRGFAGAAGNVLVDGVRPSSKTDDLGSLLSRIPAGSVERIEVIRGGAPGIDMQGRSVLANVVRKANGATEITTVAVGRFFGDGRFGPAFRVNAAHRSAAGWSFDGTAVIIGDQPDDGGKGSDHVQTGSGARLSDAGVNIAATYKAAQWRSTVEGPLSGGRLHLNLNLDYSTYRETEFDRVMDVVTGARTDTVFSQDRDRHGEFGGDYTHALGDKTSVKIVALQSLKTETYASDAAQDGGLYSYGQNTQSGESILRATLTHTWSPSLSLETGGELAYNFLKGDTRYAQNGVPVALPSARVKVEEQRGEAFASLTWKALPSLNIEAGVRVEASQISQSGDTNKSASFVFPKPRLLATWSVDVDTQLRFRVEREVGQLDFGDYVASANLTTGNVNAGNPNLEPQTNWIFEGVVERHFWGKGAVSLTASHSTLQQVIDQIPVGGLNAPGNIGDGTREKVGLDVTLPLAAAGMKGGLLKTSSSWVWSDVTDPTTGKSRRISGERPYRGDITLTNDVPALNSTWSVEVISGFRQTYYRIDQVQTNRYASWVMLTWDYKPQPNLLIEAQLINALSRTRSRSQDTYAALRSNSVVATHERYEIELPPTFLIRFRKVW